MAEDAFSSLLPTVSLQDPTDTKSELRPGSVGPAGSHTADNLCLSSM